MMPADLISWTTWTPLANHLWQSTLFVGAVWLVTVALTKNRAAVRYWFWFSASVKFLFPLSLLVALGSKLDWRTAPALTPLQWSSVMDNVAQPFVATAPVVRTVAPHGSFPLTVILLCVWLCGVVGGLIFWLRCWQQMRSVRRKAIPLALSLPIPVFSSCSQIEPGVFGILRPVLLLPEGIAGRLTAAQLNAIVAHEMAHVRRRDNLTAAIHMVVETVFWFVPLVWWIRARLVEEREHACDEEVLRLGSEAESYAEGIIEVCKSYAASPAACICGISGSDLKKRIIRIADRRYGDDLTLARKFVLACICIAACVGPLLFGLVNAPLLRAQSIDTDWEKAAGGKMSFDVTSVKQNTTAVASSPVPLDDSDTYTPTGGLFIAKGFPLIRYIEFAYKVELSPKQIESLMAGLPNWVRTDHFDIQAQMDGKPTKDQLRLMMQSLLADRFKLAVHFEERTLPVYALVLTRPGSKAPQLRPHSEGKSCENSGSSDDSATEIKVNDVSTFPCGGFVTFQGTNGLATLGARDVPFDLIASHLPESARVDRPVIDQTGLSGTYDFRVQWSTELSNRPMILSVPAAQPEGPGPTFAEALKEQLGLKLVPTTGSVKTLIIDHIEEPLPD
jgi:bla regulator protein BlaR1